MQVIYLLFFRASCVVYPAPFALSPELCALRSTPSTKRLIPKRALERCISTLFASASASGTGVSGWSCLHDKRDRHINIYPGNYRFYIVFLIYHLLVSGPSFAFKGTYIRFCRKSIQLKFNNKLLFRMFISQKTVALPTANCQLPTATPHRAPRTSHPAPTSQPPSPHTSSIQTLSQQYKPRYVKSKEPG
jgi:hypothetical protein